ncbi:MAG: hypothetical protein AAF716_14330 [Cyanobacteria bacterium P01_D01_bin.1]
MISVTFDSNVWEKIAVPIEQCVGAYKQLRQAVENRSISAYICEIALSIESIQKKNRPALWQTYHPRMEEDIQHVQGSEFSGTFSISPDNSEHPGIHPKQQPKLIEAQELGFQILRMTNFGTIRCLNIPDKMFVNLDDNFWEYAERLGECSEFIVENGWGRAQYESLRYRYNLQGVSVVDAPSKIPIDEHKVFYKSTAEWVDGDALSAHYGSQNDYFCTEDTGKGAGSQSVFYPSNLDKIKEKFDLKVLSMSEILKLLIEV